MFALDGMVVLDATQIMSGPYCGLLLADMGADVIKIEKPEGGDDSRRFGPFPNGESAGFMAMNRNKRGLALNLKSEEGCEIFRQLAAKADVILENFRPGTLQKMGLGYEDLQKLNPGLIYCSVSGFGQTGPYAKRGGFDLVAQGMSGLMSFTGEPDGNPAKVGVPIADLNAGMYAAYGVLSAYIHRLKTGQGQYVDVSLLESSLAYTFWESNVFFYTGQSPQPMGSAHRLSAPYQAFKTADLYINIGAANQANWGKLCQVIERPDLLVDPRFTTNASRMEHYRELAALIDEVLKTRPSAEWLAKLEQAGVPAGPIYDMAGVYSDPQVQAREMLIEIEHPVAGKAKNIGPAAKLSLTPARIYRPAPLLGQHSREVLQQFLGWDDTKIDRLRDQGVILEAKVTGAKI
jgi:crotonobetainyl-CoA:carnitine CoA-transferase CaiB-like acyl-CoA transferase